MTVVVGVDCATVPERTGVAIGRVINDQLFLDAVYRPDRALDVDGIIVAALTGTGPAVLALDAPLGWPSALGDALASHLAGAPIAAPPSALFSRATDRAIRARLGKQPLEVGADRIARTAVAALGLLGRVRAQTGRALEVTVAAAPQPDAIAIEVYPAALVAANGARPRGEVAMVAAKTALVLDAFGPGVLDHCPAVRTSVDALDAALCVVAAADWLHGRAVPPPPELGGAARREGWIWAR